MVINNLDFHFVKRSQVSILVWAIFISGIPRLVIMA